VTPTRFIPFLFAACATAQPLLSPQEAVATALRSHPLLSAAGARTEAAAGLAVQAGLRPNPRLILQTENWRAYGTPSFSPTRDADIFAYLSKQLETGGKRDLRVELANTGFHRSEQERQVLERQIALRVSQAYWSAAGAEKLHRLLAENAVNFQQIVDYHEQRVRQGAMAEADLVKVQLERERLNVAIQGAALEAERTLVLLFREMGQTNFPQVTLAELPDRLEPVLPPADFAAANDRRAEIKLARQAVEHARTNLKLQRANARPDVEVMAGYKRTAGFHTVIGGLQLNLPFSNRNQGAIAAADSQIRAAEWELRTLEADIAAEIRTAEADLRSRADQLKRYFGEVDGAGLRGKAAESSRIALAAYREGGTDLLRLLDAERVRIETQVLYYKTLTEYRLSMAALDAALGVNP
jgi:outer membrane protein, heavy metal efflux system